MNNAEIINSVNVKELKAYIDSCRVDPSKAERNINLVAKWIGDEHSKVEVGDKSFEVGNYAKGQVSPMEMLLGCLAACDAGVIAEHAALIGLRIESLTVEAYGHFNVLDYLGLKSEGGAGYDSAKLTFKLNAPGVTPEQIAKLTDILESGSPVGNSFTRKIPVKLEFMGSEMGGDT